MTTLYVLDIVQDYNDSIYYRTDMTFIDTFHKPLHYATLWMLLLFLSKILHRTNKIRFYNTQCFSVKRFLKTNLNNYSLGANGENPQSLANTQALWVIKK